MKPFYLTIILFHFANSITVPTTNCGPKNAPIKINSVEISPCSKNPCTMKKGDTYNIEINFTSYVESKVLKSKVCGKPDFFVCIDFPLPVTDACSEIGDSKNMNMNKCPLEKNKDYIYKTKMPIDPKYPSMDLVGKWKLLGDSNRELSCFMMHVLIRDDERENESRLKFFPDFREEHENIENNNILL